MTDISELKGKVLHATSIHEAWSAFMDFMEEPRLSSEQETVDFDNLKEHHVLHQVLACIEQQASVFLGKSVTLKKPMLCRMPAYHLYHGFCACAGEPLFLAYFSDIETGLFMLNGLSKQQDYFRFKVVKISSETLTH